MDSIFLYAITLGILPLSSVILLIFFIRKWSDRSLNYPPGSSGFPFLGETVQFLMLGSTKFVSGKMKRYSPHVFKTSLFGQKFAIFCGVEGNKFLFTNDTKQRLTSWWPPSMTKVLYSMETIGDMSAISRRSLLDVVKTDSLKEYVTIMDAMARKHIEKEWAPYQQVKAYHLVLKHTFGLSCRLFMSVEDPALIKKLAEHYDCIINGLLSVPIDLPGTAYNTAIKGGKMVHQELLKIIKKRRKEQMENQEISAGRHDLLSRMLLETDVNGQYSSDNDISKNIIGLLVASYEPTSSAIAFVLKHLAEHPHIYNEVLREQMEIAEAKGPDDLLTMEDIGKMKYSLNVLRETLRVTPAGEWGFREALTDLTYAGFRIPKGWKAFWNVYTTHKDPRYFPDPEKFDPTRFDGNGPVPYSYVPFGGGIHMCPGQEFARLDVLVFMHNIVKRFKLEIVIPNEKTVHYASLVPLKGLPLRLHPNGME